MIIFATVFVLSASSYLERDPVALGLKRAQIPFHWFNETDRRVLYNFAFGFGSGPSYVGFPYGRADRMVIVTKASVNSEDRVLVSCYTTEKGTRFRWGLEFSSKRDQKRSYEGTIGSWLKSIKVYPKGRVSKSARTLLNSKAPFAFYTTDDVGGTLTLGSMDADGTLQWNRPPFYISDIHYTLGLRGLPEGHEPIALPISVQEQKWLIRN